MMLTKIAYTHPRIPTSVAVATPVPTPRNNNTGQRSAKILLFVAVISFC